jgi:hypothetical protein
MEGRGREGAELEGGWVGMGEELVMADVEALVTTWDALAITRATLTEIGGFTTRRPALARTSRALIRTWRAWDTTGETLSATWEALAATWEALAVTWDVLAAT